MGMSTSTAQASTTPGNNDNEEILIFRVEYAKPGEYLAAGPYRMSFFIRYRRHNDEKVKLAAKKFTAMVNRHNSSKKHPSPSDDGLNVQTHHYFGFSSAEQLSRWFNRCDRKTMAELGFVLAVYRVARRYTKASKTQATFEKNCAKQIGTICLRQNPKNLQAKAEKLAQPA